jgi:DMSO/TMAO reductase YedYZ molybdopterin-dependent catalytic subunit
MSLRTAVVALGLIAAAWPAWARDAAVAVTGDVEHELHLSRDELREMPQTKVSVSFQTHHGKEAGRFSGVLLWKVLEQAVMSDDGKKGAMLRHTVVVTGRDGYAVALSAGEISPEFAGKTVILALAKNGKPLDRDEGPQLIVPGDKRGGRAVHDVVSIEVR